MRSLLDQTKTVILRTIMNVKFTIAIIFLLRNQSLCPCVCFYILFICHVCLFFMIKKRKEKKKDMVHLAKWVSEL